MTRPQLTMELVRAAATDAGNASARKAGRIKWNRADYNAATKVFDRLESKSVEHYMTACMRRLPLKKNPPARGPLYGARSRKGAAAHLIGLEVYEIRYRHATDGLDYSHEFQAGVIMLGQSDGTIKIESATGKKLWEEINV